MKKIFTIITEEDGPNKKDKISVVIRTRNYERWIGHVIQSVIDHLDKTEIINVDINPTDQTLDIVKYFVQAPDLENEMKNKYTKIKIKSVKNYSPAKL